MRQYTRGSLESGHAAAILAHTALCIACAAELARRLEDSHREHPLEKDVSSD